MSQLLFLVLLLCGSLASAWCPASVCPYTYGTIYAGQTHVAGDLVLYSTSNGIGIQITSVNGWTYSKVDIYVGNTPPPCTASGPAPGSFPHKSSDLESVTTFTLELTFAELGLECGFHNLYIAVHTVMSNPSLGQGYSATETGWCNVDGHSHSFPVKWGWYFDWETCCCASQTTHAQTTRHHQRTRHETTKPQTTHHQRTHRQETTKAQTTHRQETTKAQTTHRQETTKPQTTHRQETTKAQTTHRQETTKPQTTHRQETTKAQTTHRQETTKPQTTHRQETTKAQTTHRQETTKAQTTHRQETTKAQTTHRQETTKPQTTHRQETTKPQTTHRQRTTKAQTTHRQETTKPQTTHRQETTKPQTTHRQETTKPQTTHRQRTTKPQTTHRQETTKAQTTHRQETTKAQTTHRQETTKPQTTHRQRTRHHQTTRHHHVGGCSDIHHFFGEVPSAYNVFSFGDFVCHNSDTQGRVAARENIDIRYYSVGCQLFNFNPSSNCAAYGYTCQQIAESGDLVDTVVAGGNVIAYNVQIVAGNIAFGGTYNNDITVQLGAGCTLFHGQLIDFNEWYAYLTQLSSVISHLNPTASVVNTYGSLSITASGSSTLEVFNIPASELCSSHGLTVTGASRTASIFFNVAGTAVNCINGYQMNGFSANHTVWNFYEASTLTFQNFAWIGSILAPHAVMQNSQSGNFNGQVFVASWESSTGQCSQQNWIPFVGCIPGQ